MALVLEEKVHMKCYLPHISTHYTIKGLKWSTIKRLQGPRQYYRTLNCGACVPVWGVPATHRFSRFDLRVFNTQQKCSYRPNLYSPLLRSHCIWSPLLSFPYGGGRGLHTHLFMVNVKCHSVIKLTIWCINRKLQKKRCSYEWVSLLVVCSSWVRRTTQMRVFVRHLSEVSQTEGEIVNP